MRTYVGEQSRDGSVQVYVKIRGKRHLVHPQGKDVARSILGDMFGRRYIEEDAARYREFRETFIAPRAQQPEWSLTEEDIRGWASRYETYQAILRQNRARQQATTPVAVPPTQPQRGPDTPKTRQDERVSSMVRVVWDRGAPTTARLLYKTAQMALLEGDVPAGGHPPAVGTLVRLTFPGEKGMRGGRIAAYGQSNVYLVALGSRAIRGSKRVRVDLPAVVQSSFLGGRRRRSARRRSQHRRRSPACAAAACWQ